MELTIGKLYRLNQIRFFKIIIKQQNPQQFGKPDYPGYVKLFPNTLMVLTAIRQESIGCLELTFFVNNKIMKLLYFPNNKPPVNFLDKLD